MSLKKNKGKAVALLTLMLLSMASSTCFADQINAVSANRENLSNLSPDYDNSSFAKDNDKKGKKVRTVDAVDYVIGKKIYIFAYSSELGDSVHYLSAIQELDNVPILKKKRFLLKRDNFSDQFKKYVIDKFGRTNQTAMVVFGSKKAKVEKKMAKLRKIKLHDKNAVINNVSESDFSFSIPMTLNNNSN